MTFPNKLLRPIVFRKRQTFHRPLTQLRSGLLEETKSILLANRFTHAVFFRELQFYH